MKLAVMTISKYSSPKIKLLYFPIFILVGFFFLLLDLPVEDCLAKIHPFLVEKKHSFPLGQLVSPQNYYLSTFQG